MGRILTINTGSSSLKASLHHANHDDRPAFAAEFDRIGQTGGGLGVHGEGGSLLSDQSIDLPDHSTALRAILARLAEADSNGVAAIGHRIVFGGRTFVEPRLVTDDVLAELRQLVAFAPNHLPQALDAVEIARSVFPAVPQVLCFDTAFHRTMPRVARIYALPHRFEEEGVIRFGFHGLSYESIVEQLRVAGDASAGGRLVVAHLGNGASMAAVRDGESVETTMGFTPSGGLMMGTRAGDLDPGVMLHILQQGGHDLSSLGTLVNKEAGLLGVSGVSADMCYLLEREAEDPRAFEAIALFCYQAKKFLGALVAVLGGLDTLVFTGGIGEHASPIRERICTGLGFLGVEIDQFRNKEGAAVISPDSSPVTVRVMRSAEDLIIATHTRRLVQGAESHVPI